MLVRVRHAARRLARARTFTASAIITLMLGIGGTTAVFTVVNGVLLRPLPFRDPGQLVDLSHTLAIPGVPRVDLSDATYLLYRSRNRVFTDVGLYRATAVNLRAESGAVDGSDTPAERAAAASATAGLFHVLQAGALRGRVLADGDDAPGAPPVVVIGERLWQRKFGGDPSIVGRHVMVDGVERNVVGVMPARFRFPSAATELWIPLSIDPAHTASAAFDYRGIARLRPGVTPEAATTDLAGLLPQVPEVYPGRLSADGITATHMRPDVRPLRDVVVGNVGRILWVVLGAVGVLLLIACANVANLFLARAEGRQRELAVRRALGASRGTLLAEFLSEALLIAGTGGVLGLAGAAVGVHVLQSTDLGAGIPRMGDVTIDGVVVLVTVCTAVVVALVVSLVPVLRSARLPVASVLVAHGPWSTGDRTRARARRALVIAQVALALVLLTGAGLFARSFARLRTVNPGFVADHALSFRLSLPRATYPAARDAAGVVVRTLDALRALPGVQAVGMTSKLPLDDESRSDSTVFVEDHPIRPGTIPAVDEITFVTPEYFRAMGIPLIAGRVFAAPDPGADVTHVPREVIVSRAFADHYWKGTVAIGKRIRMNATDPWSTIVGVVGSVHDDALEQPPTATVYVPLISVTAAGTPWAPHEAAFVVRAIGDPTALTEPIRRAVQAIDPGLPVYRVTLLGDLLSAAVARTTFTLLLLGVAAIVAMSIGAMGIYGVISYLVSLRTREIGVRLALGARPDDVRRLVSRRALSDAAAGVAIGLAGAMVLTRVAASVLFGVSPTDPVTLAGASVVLLATAVAASWLPAHRAASLDPAIALRVE